MKIKPDMRYYYFDQRNVDAHTILYHAYDMNFVVWKIEVSPEGEVRRNHYDIVREVVERGIRMPNIYTLLETPLGW